MISVVLPIYLPSDEHRKMTDRNLLIAKSNTNVECEWVIVETASNYYEDYADVYLHERTKTTPNISINNGFKAASGDYVVFLANDVEVCDGWVEKMYECFMKRLDCGIASLGNNEHRDLIKNEIVKDLYFTVSMFKKEDAWFDPFYKYIFDDTDMIFRLYTQGKKFYKNLSGFVNHKTHSTYGQFGGCLNEYDRSRQYFMQKWKAYKDDKFFQQLAGING